MRFYGAVPAGGPSKGSLSVVDLSGRVLFRREVIASDGRFEVLWNGRIPNGARLPSGIYHARLDVGGHNATTRVVILE